MRLLAATVAVLALATACTSAGGDQPSGASGPSTAELKARAALDPCPPSTDAGAAPQGLPDLTLACLGDGPAVHLAGLRGAPSVLNVWGSWCQPCQREVPHFNDVYTAARGRFRLLGVDTVDSPRSALDFAAHVGMRWPSVVDDDRALLSRYNPGPPVTLFVDPSGRVVHVTRGPYTTTAAVRADIARYLGVRL